MRERILNTIGFSLLALCFVASIGRIALRKAKDADPDLVTIRFSHWQLESGLRDALDALSREYEAECAKKGFKVRVEQLPIPERVYPNWSITQLVGGTAPDLVEMGGGPEVDERVARYFEPLTKYVGEPNPYNAGTDLEGVPWRETFIDGLVGRPGYNENLFDYYGIPMSMFTVRVFYNKVLYREICGDAPLPTTYEEFIHLCERVEAYAKEKNRILIAVAGSKYNGPFVMDGLFMSQTQKSSLEMDKARVLRYGGEERNFGYMMGDWNLKAPDIRAGVELMQTVASHMQPGFPTLMREDATLYFVQRRALMIGSGSWDAPSLQEQAPFEVGVFRLPQPSRSNLMYGPNVIGPVSEAGTGTGGAFHLTRSSKNPEVAIDFMRFITSKRGAAIFTDISHWLPAVVGVPPHPSIAGFMPETKGYPPGYVLHWGSECKRVYDSVFYKLTETPDDPGPFLEELAKGYDKAVTEDMWLADKGRLKGIQRNDSTFAALSELLMNSPDDPELKRKFEELIESQTLLEEGNARSRMLLQKAGHPPTR